MKVGILGMGSWGTALAVRLAERGHEIRGWSHKSSERRALERDRENRRFLPGCMFPATLAISDSPAETMVGAELGVLAVPSFAVRTVARETAGDFGGIPVVNVAKGLEEATHKLMHQVLAEELGEAYPTVALVGPSHAEEVACHFPTAVVAASRDMEAATAAQELFTDATFRVYTNEDVLGVELAAALKNVIALAAGIAAGLGYGDNTMGALLTRGLAEITRLGEAAGARRQTFFGLAGVGISSPPAQASTAAIEE